MDEICKIKLNESLALLEELTVKGSRDVAILSNVFIRLNYIAEQENKGAVIDNTAKKEA